MVQGVWKFSCAEEIDEWEFVENHHTHQIAWEFFANIYEQNKASKNLLDMHRKFLQFQECGYFSCRP